MSRPLLIGVGAAYAVGEGDGLGFAGPVLEALCVAAERGIDCALLSLRGGDALGEAQADWLKRAAIADLSSTYLSRPTPHLPDDGSTRAEWPQSFGLYEFAFAKQLRRRGFRDACAGAAAIVVDDWVPASAVARLAAGCGLPVHAIVGDGPHAAAVATMPGLASVFAAEAQDDGSRPGASAGRAIAETLTESAIEPADASARPAGA